MRFRCGHQVSSCFATRTLEIAATWNHPNPPPFLPEANPRPASSGEDEAVAELDGERIEPGLDPPPSAEIIAKTYDPLARRTQQLRDQGRSLEQIIEIFSTAFPELCYHPLRRAEVERAFFSPKISDHPSEDEIALAFVTSVAEFARFVAVWGKWLVWRETYWETEETLQITDLTRVKCREMGARRKVVVTAVESLARSDRRVASHPSQWDSDPWLFNSTGGVFDLMSGEFRENRPKDHCTKIAGCGPAPEGSGCPLWLDFLDVVFQKDPELIGYIQRVCGYCLTSSIREHSLFFLFGNGGNGKSVFVQTLAGILGTYHQTAPISTFTAERYGSSHPTDLAGLRGARLVTAIETEEGRAWAEAKICALTGGDEISARFMRQDFFSFTPTFKLMIAGNHQSRLRAVNEAIRRRFQMIPFAVTIPPEKRDRDLTDKLKSEWGAILNWMVEGCAEWQRRGLYPPKRVIEETNKYLESEDAIGLWIEDYCQVRGNYECTSFALYSSWKAWAEGAGERPGTRKDFSKALESRGFDIIRIGKDRTRGYKGLRVNPIHERPSDEPSLSAEQLIPEPNLAPDWTKKQ